MTLSKGNLKNILQRRKIACIDSFSKYFQKQYSRLYGQISKQKWQRTYILSEDMQCQSW